MALIAAAKTMQENEYEGDERTAVRILRRSLEEPLRRIASNAGKDGSVIVQEVKEADKINWGYDAQQDNFGDMVDKGVIDPALVTRAALENAVSIAAMVLTTNCLVSEKEDDTPPVQPTGMSGAPPMPASAMGGY